MKLATGPLARTAIAVVCLAMALSAHSLAQGRGGPGGPPPGGGGGGMGGGGMNGGAPGSPPSPPFGGSGPGSGNPNIGPNTGQTPGGQGGAAAENPMRTGFQLGPPAQKWWDDKSFVKNLKLRPEQQTRMDAIFEQNKNTLVSRLQNLEQAQSQMKELAGSPNPDEATLFTQIDRVAQARAELEKANTHMLLQIRKEMDADQISRLEKRH